MKSSKDGELELDDPSSGTAENPSFLVFSAIGNVVSDTFWCSTMNRTFASVFSEGTNILVLFEFQHELSSQNPFDILDRGTSS